MEVDLNLPEVIGISKGIRLGFIFFFFFFFLSLLLKLLFDQNLIVIHAFKVIIEFKVDHY
jgi:ABC-type Fe3+-siderophore transport system permease subunit